MVRLGIHSLILLGQKPILISECAPSNSRVGGTLWLRSRTRTCLDQTDAHVEAARMKTTAEQELKEFYRVQCADCTVSATAFH
jgi:hypothetical protein